MNVSAYPTGTPAAVGRARRRRPVRTVVALALICAFLVAAVVVWWPRRTVVRVIDQPPGVTYADGVTHVAVLTRVRAPVAAIRLSQSLPPAVDHYEVVLGRDPGGGYGHRVRFEATGLDPADLTVEWTADGAWLTYPTTHRVFVPAAFFIGGR